MTSPFLQVVQRIIDDFPAMRTGQIIDNIWYDLTHDMGASPFYADEEELLQAAQAYYNKLRHMESK